jgi:hypothetical protein
MNLVDRAKNMILTPKTEWAVVAAEPTPQAQLITGYVLPLAAVSAIAGFIGSSFIGLAGIYRIPLMAGLGMALFQIVAAVISCFVVGFIIDALATTFGGEKNSLQAFKVAVYSYTPAWVAGVFQIIPFLGTLIAFIGALYAIYLLYLGLPRLMKAPEDKAIGYTIVVIVCAIIVGFVLAAISGMFLTAGLLGSRGVFGAMTPAASVQAQLDPNTPLGKLEQLGQKLDESAKKMDAAQKSGDSSAQVSAAMEGLGALLGGGRRVEPLTTDQMKTFVPETFGGFPRTSSRAERSGVAGLMVATAEADYGDGQKSIALEVTDTGGVSGLVGLASWAGVMGEKEDDDGFERTQKVGGRIVHEKGSKRAGGQNEFGIVLGNRFVVSAKSSSVALNDLKAAVSAMDLAKLEALKDVGAK